MDKDNITQNLLDAGCDSLFIEEFFRLQKSGQEKELFRLLAKHKSKLLESLYENQKKIDCLDYLVFRFKERNTNENN